MKKVEVVVLLLVAALCAGPALAEGWQQVATPSTGSTTIEWQPQADAAGYVLTVSAPDGTVERREFKAREVPSFSVFDANGQVRADGTYTYELRAVPQIDKATRQQLRAAREAGDETAVIAELQKAGRIPAEALVQSGSFAVAGGAFVSGDASEPRYTGSRPAKAVRDPNQAGFKDQVIPDDLIVQGSLCVGFDCVNNESFGFDTIRLKENNTRIKFEDTSVGTFPTNDWQLTANDSASGGQSKLSIEDITGARVPFTVEAGATTNSVYIDSTGRVGFRTSTPVLDIHISTSNTPAIRLEQNNSGGFTAQTWDIAGNEANFFVRDVTSGSRLPFRIRPGAPTSSIDISADGDVGIGTGSPAVRLDVQATSAGAAAARIRNSDAAGFSAFEYLDNGGTVDLFFGIDNANSTTRLNSLNNNPILLLTNSTERFRIISNGNIGIGGVAAPTNPIQHSNGAVLNNLAQWVDGSSRDLKQDISDLASAEAVETLNELNPVKYHFKAAPEELQVGFIAEDVPELVAQKSRKGLSSLEIVAVLTKVVQEQQRTIDELSSRLSELEKQKN